MFYLITLWWLQAVVVVLKVALSMTDATCRWVQLLHHLFRIGCRTNVYTRNKMSTIQMIVLCRSIIHSIEDTAKSFCAVV